MNEIPFPVHIIQAARRRRMWMQGTSDLARRGQAREEEYLRREGACLEELDRVWEEFPNFIPTQRKKEVRDPSQAQDDGVGKEDK